MAPLISVIVPVYKVEKFLDRCVESIISQTYKNIEIILVDDGSPDNCGKMCDLWAEKDSRIKVIHKDNGGLSDARNFGTEASGGEYIAFIDSDDYILPEYLQHLYDNLVAHNVDISCCGLKEVFGMERLTYFPETNTENDVEIITGKDACFKMYQRGYEVYLVVAWAKLFRRSLIKSIPFPVGRLHEDEATLYKILYESKAIVLSKQKLYCYYQNINSIMHSNVKKRLKNILTTFDERIAFFKSRNELELQNQASDKLVRIQIKEHYNDSQSRFSKEEVKFFFNNKLSKNISKETKVNFLYYLISPKLYKKHLYGFKNSFIDSIYRLKYYLLFIPTILKILFSHKKERKVFVLATDNNEKSNNRIYKIGKTAYFVCKNILSRLVKKDDLIIIDAGEKCGTLDTYVEGIIKDIANNFSENQLIILPKTVDYKKSDTGYRLLYEMSNTLLRCKDLTYFTYDKCTLEFLCNNFSTADSYLLDKNDSLYEAIKNIVKQ